jgi:hypothetical protein
MKRSYLILLTFFCMVQMSMSQSLQWAHSFGGTNDDYGTSVAVGPSGNVYSTGVYVGPVDFDPGMGVHILPNNHRGFLCKLSPNGNFIWAQPLINSTYTVQSHDIKVDAAENVYVTGDFSGTCDFDPGPGVFNMTCGGFSGSCSFIAKYDSSGDFIWAKSYVADSSQPGSVQSWGIAIDGAGNVLTTGFFAGSVDFDPGIGSQLRQSNGAGFEDAFIVKLSSAGSFLWAQRLGDLDDDRARSIGLDFAGNAYILGSGYGGVGSQYSGGLDFWVCKFDPSGTLLWESSCGGPGFDTGIDIAVDSAGNSFATGMYEGEADFDPSPSFQNLQSAGSYDGYILKLDPNGNRVWAKSIGGSGFEEGRTIALDPNGAVYTVGIFGSTTDFDPGIADYFLTPSLSSERYILKLDAAGDFVYAGKYGGPGYTDKEALAVSSVGEVYTVGAFQGTKDFDPTFGTYNLSSNGNDEVFIQKLGICIPPSAPVSTTGPNNLTICAGDAAVLSASGNGLLEWFSGPVGGVPLANGSSFMTPILTATTTFYVQTFTCLASSRIALTVNVIPSSIASLTATVCDNYSSPSGQIWTASGTYTDTVPNFIGCDSIITVQLTVNNSTGSTISPITCQPYISPSGQVWATSGTYQDTIPNQAGCDSIITVQLTVNNSTASTISPVTCQPYISPSGQVWATSGTYQDTIPNQGGCDSIITVQLTVNNSTASTISPVTCQPYISPSGQVWATSGTYQDSIPNQAGCDSIITVQLTVHVVNASVTNSSPILTANVANAAYQWIYCDSVAISGATNQSFTATSTGDYAVIITQNGCTDTSACAAVNIVGLQDNFLRFNLFPNPTHGNVHLTCAEDCGILQLQVSDAFGKVVLQQTLENVAENVFTLRGASGVYFVELRSDDGRRALLKVVKF